MNFKKNKIIDTFGDPDVRRGRNQCQHLSMRRINPKNKPKVFHTNVLAILLVILAVSCTDVDSRFKKAERLSRQAAADYQKAIQEFRAILATAANKSLALQKLELI